MSEQAAIVVGPAIPDVGGVKCERDNCSELATFSYLWDWGESGKCCSKHAALLQQTSGQLQRGVTITALPATGPVPLTRDERARLKGEAYALEAELEEVKARGLALYQENGVITRTAQAATVRLRETEQQLRESNVEVERLRTELEKRDAEHGNLVDEVGRLRTLAKFQPDTDHTRVDG